MCRIQKIPSKMKTFPLDSRRGTSSLAFLSACILGMYFSLGQLSLSSLLWKGFVGSLGFLVLLISFTNFYVGRDLRKCSPLAEHLAPSVESQPAECLHDLDKVAGPSLSKMWHDEIQAKEKNLTILLTGVTGYVGRAFLFQLLREMANAELNGKTKLQHKILVILRARKGLTAGERLLKLKNELMFASLKKQWDDTVVAVEAGDLNDDLCGMSAATLEFLEEAMISHVVHCAADVNFNRPLADSAGINISPALQLQALAQSWSSCSRFVHCSTAFVNPGHGSEQYPMAEELFSLQQYDPLALYESMRGDQKLALKAKKELKFPNNYVFTKCVAEHLVVRGNRNMKLHIVRPGIVGPAWMLPEPAWNGDKPSTITALMLLWGTRVVRFTRLSSKPIPMIPVDVVGVGLLHAMITQAEEVGSEGSDGPSIRNLVWDHKSSYKCSLDAMMMARRSIHAAVLKQHFTVTETAISFALNDLVYKFPRLFPGLHLVFNLGPLYVLQFVCWASKQLGIKSILDQLPVTKLLKFGDMMTIYEPYTGRDFYFASTLNVPESLNANQYCVSLFKATHAFWDKMFPGTVESFNDLELLPKGRWDLWWALTQPGRTFKQRVMGFTACKILRMNISSVKVDTSTLSHAAHTMLKIETEMLNGKECVVLAPSKSALMDRLMVKYMAFSMAGIGLDVPQSIFDETETYHRHHSIMAFLGESSRGLYFQNPSATKILRAVAIDLGAQQNTLIPISLDYDSMGGASIETANDIGILGSLAILLDSTIHGRNRKCLRDVHISFGKPITFIKHSDFASIAMHVRKEHQRLRPASVENPFISESPSDPGTQSKRDLVSDRLDDVVSIQRIVDSTDCVAIRAKLSLQTSANLDICSAESSEEKNEF